MDLPLGAVRDIVLMLGTFRNPHGAVNNDKKLLITFRCELIHVQVFETRFRKDSIEDI